ncbi:unnamed protein product [Linum trigynum]|uniref:Aminotransferase-like plant mobile domain-containing protein n=1 Tax=Linum trigynum TaxID=586398 RepID=A0AAV2E7J3_9ROSI
MASSNAQLKSSVLFKNQSFRNAATYSWYLCRFRDRPLYPSFSIQPTAFSKYDMNIPAYLHKGPGSDPSFFTTIVYDYEIKVTPEMLASVLEIPHSGIRAGTDSEFQHFGFQFDHALASLTRDIGRWFASPLAAGRLPDDLKVLFFFLTRWFLPRDLASTDFIHSPELWVLFNARAGRRISYASLMFQHMIKFGSEYYSGPLPFGPQITRLLYRLGIDLRDKVIVCDVLDDLHPQHVLERVDALVGPRKPVTGSGGVASQQQMVSSTLVNAAAAAYKQEASAKSGPKRRMLIEKDLMLPKFIYESNQISEPISPDSHSGDEDDRVSSYVSPPNYPF